MVPEVADDHDSGTKRLSMKCRICDAHASWAEPGSGRYGIGDRPGLTMVFPEDARQPLHERGRVWVCEGCAVAVAVAVVRDRGTLRAAFRRARRPRG
jgi:hypothetical protein